GACTSKPVQRAAPPVDAGVDAGPGADGGDGGDGGPGRPDGGPQDGGPADGGTSDAGLSGAWEPLGPPLGHDAQVYPAMALDPSGALLVALADLVEQPGTTATEVRVVRWSGQAWEPVGGTVTRSVERFPFSAPLWVRLTTDTSGRPVLAVGDSGPGSTSGAFPVHSWVFDGTAWQPVPIPGGAQQLGGLALGSSSQGRVHLALSTGRELDLYTLGPGGWAREAAPLAVDGGLSEPDLFAGTDGSTLLAFSNAPAPGSFGALRAWRHGAAGWVDLGLPSPAEDGLLFHTPRIRERSDGGVVVAVSEWRYDAMGKLQTGVAVPVFALGEGGWSRLDADGPPGGFGLSDPIPGSPVGLQLAGDVPVAVSTGADGGVLLRAFTASGSALWAPVIGGVGAGTLLLLPDGTPVVGAVTQLQQEPGPQSDGGRVQILHFTGAVTGL
ncbi:MAG TPA: hypothetical protein VLQ79_05955, partial [Myxococcaceae bacterium]|nr:hypothetical protein [Myxococcaceae bacterium]